MNSGEASGAATGVTAGRSPDAGTSTNGAPVGWIAAWGAGFVLWAAARHLPYPNIALVVPLGAGALVLSSASAWTSNRGRARTFRLCEMAARAAWTTGALAMVSLFEATFLGPSAGLGPAAHALASAFVAALYGGVLAAGLLALAFRVTGAAPHPAGTSADGQAHHAGAAGRRAGAAWLGRVAFVLLMAWPVVEARWAVPGGRLVETASVLHWPAVLALLGVAGVMAVIGGAAMRRQGASVVLASAGTVVALGGLVQALLGLAAASLGGVTAGIEVVLTTCFATLAGLAVVTHPLDDRAYGDGTGPGPTTASRVAWALFPLVTIVLMAWVVVLVLTPMTRPA